MWMLALAAGDRAPLHAGPSTPSLPLHWAALGWQRGQHPYGQAVLGGAAAACRGQWSAVAQLLLQLPWLRPVLLAVVWDMAPSVAGDGEAVFLLRRDAVQHLGRHAAANDHAPAVLRGVQVHGVLRYLVQTGNLRVYIYVYFALVL